MVHDVESFTSQAADLHTEFFAAQRAWDSASDALDQAEIAFEESPADPDLLKKFKEAEEDESKKQERYQELEKQIERHCTERRALIVYLNAPKLTMREAVRFQYPLLEEPSDPDRPFSNAQPAAPQTYTEIEHWELSEAACELVNSLDNKQRLYLKPACHIQHQGSSEPEVDIRGRVVRVMDTVNDALEQLGSAVRCHGGGNGRSMSFADLVMRLDSADDTSNLKDLSRQVLGTVLVKKDFSLRPDESLQEALDDPQRGGRIKAFVQEAYGMAVVDEAPVFALTSFNVTVFFRRSHDVRDTRLWASKPVWANQADPSACAMWALVLQQAEQLRSWKAVLPRAQVPTYAQELSSLQRRGSAESTSSSSASSVNSGPVVSSVNSGSAVSGKRKRAEERQTDVPRTPVSRPVQRGSPCPRLSLQACSPYSRVPLYEVRDPEPQSAAIGFKAEATLPLSELGLTGEILKASQHSYTLKGAWGGEPAAVEVFNLRKRGAAAQYETEKGAYSSLSDLDGKTMPRFLCSGLQAHTAAPVIVTSY